MSAAGWKAGIAIRSASFTIRFLGRTQIRQKQRHRIEKLAQAVLDARDQFPDATLAALYDPNLMKPLLRRAHATLDAAVDRLYRPTPFVSERERAEHLFTLYERLTAPALAAMQQPAKRRRTPR